MIGTMNYLLHYVMSIHIDMERFMVLLGHPPSFASFNKNLSSWDITGLSTAVSIFQGGGLDTANYTDTIVGWAVQVYNNSNLPSSVNMSGIPASGVFDGNRTTDNASGQAYNAKYSNWPGWSNAQAAYDYLTSTLSWTISAS